MNSLELARFLENYDLEVIIRGPGKSTIFEHKIKKVALETITDNNGLEVQQIVLFEKGTYE